MRLTARPDCGKSLNSQSFMKVGQVKNLAMQCVAFWLYTPRREPCGSLNSDANRGTGRFAATPGRLAPCGIIGMANVSPALFCLLGKLIITDKHFAVPLFRSASCRVDDLDRRDQPASEQPSNFGMIVQGKKKPATDLV